MILYQDGVQQAGGSGDSFGGGTVNTTIWGKRRTTDNNNQYDGKGSALMIYNRALTFAEQRIHWEYPLAPFQLREDYLFVKAAAAAPGLGIPIADYHYRHHFPR